MAVPVIRSLIVDDEPIARQVLREELEEIHDVEIVGEADNGQQALSRIAALQPDVVFLDLQMPGMGGFDVVRKLEGGKLPIIIVVTAYDQHAIEAFEAGAVDYLLKPVNQARLRKALDRVRQLHGKPREIAETVAQLAAAAPDPQIAARARKIVGPASVKSTTCWTWMKCWHSRPRAIWFGFSQANDGFWRTIPCARSKNGCGTCRSGACTGTRSST